MRYAPVPYIKIDPANEADLVKRAQYKAFQASNGLLTDFTAGSPLSALIEAQVYAQSEYLNYLNSLPEALLLEWLNSFAGFQRKLGEYASTTLRVEIEPHSQEWVLPKGYTVFATHIDTAFETLTNVVIPPQGTTATVSAICVDVGSAVNSKEVGLVTGISENYAWLKSITNISPIIGGEDIETLEETKSRAFQMIRRRNPVSSSDWKEFVEDYLGEGAAFDITIVDHMPVIWVRNPDGSELTLSQTEILQSKIDAKTPIGSEILLQNTPSLTVEAYYDIVTSKPVLSQAELGRIASLGLSRSSPSSYSLYQVKDLSHILSEYMRSRISPYDPLTEVSIENFRVYANPYGRPSSVSTVEYSSGSSLTIGDLVESEGKYYTVKLNFTPSGNSPRKYLNSSDLILKVIRTFNSEEYYYVGDVVKYGNENYICVSSVYIEKDTVFTDYSNSFEVRPILDFDELLGSQPAMSIFSTEKVVSDRVLQSSTALVNLNEFVISKSGDLRSAILSGLVDFSPIEIKPLETGRLYKQGEYISSKLRRGEGIFTQFYRVLKSFRYSEPLESIAELLNRGNISPKILYSYSADQPPIERYMAAISAGSTVDFGDSDGIYLCLKDTTVLDSQRFEENFYQLRQDDIVSENPEKYWSISEGELFVYDREVYRSNRKFNRIYTPEIYEHIGYVSKLENEDPFSYPGIKSWSEYPTIKEDLIYNDEEIYRVLESFTPSSDQTIDQAEREGKLIKCVAEYTGEDKILPPSERFPKYPKVVSSRISGFHYTPEGELIPEEYKIQYEGGTIS